MRRPFGALAATALGIVLAGLGLGRAQAPDDPTSKMAPAFVGVRVGKVYHRATCPMLRKVAAKGRVSLADTAAAEAGGYKACPTCKPGDPAADDPHADPAARALKVGDAPGEVLFSRDVAPVLVANCLSCHGGAQAKKKLDMNTFATLLKGSENGPVIARGNPDESEMILRVTGRSAGRRMPPGNNALAPASIARLEAWVRAGARLDAGLNPGAEIRSYAPTPDQIRRAELARLPTDERDKLAEAAGRDRLKKAGASPEPEARTSDHFLLLAALPKERADRLLKALEVGHGRLKALLGPLAATPLGGPVRIGVYVIHEPGAYAEFVRGVERRTLEAGEQAHADLAAEAPYLVALDPLGGGEELRPQAKGKSKRAEVSGPMGLEGLLAEALGREAVARAGKAPRWLAEGVGGYLAAQIEPRAQPLNTLRANAFGQLQTDWPTKVGVALRGETDPESIRAIGFSQVEWLAAAQKAQFPGFVRLLIQEGQPKFEPAVQAGWGVTLRQYVQTWGIWVGSSYARVRGE